MNQPTKAGWRSKPRLKLVYRIFWVVWVLWGGAKWEFCFRMNLTTKHFNICSRFNRKCWSGLSFYYYYYWGVENRFWGQQQKKKTILVRKWETSSSTKKCLLYVGCRPSRSTGTWKEHHCRRLTASWSGKRIVIESRLLR